MSIVLALKTLLVGSAGLGAVTIPFSVFSFRFLGKSVYMLFQSKEGNVKLYAEEIIENDTQGETLEKTEKKYEVKALYKNKPVKGTLMLCSPNIKKDNYYLLKSEDTQYNAYFQDLENKGKDCRNKRDGDVLGEKLEIKVDDGTSLTKTIMLDKCTIILNQSKLELTCKEQYNSATVKIFDQGLVWI